MRKTLRTTLVFALSIAVQTVFGQANIHFSLSDITGQPMGGAKVVIFPTNGPGTTTVFNGSIVSFTNIVRTADTNGQFTVQLVPLTYKVSAITKSALTPFVIVVSATNGTVEASTLIQDYAPDGTWTYTAGASDSRFVHRYFGSVSNLTAYGLTMPIGASNGLVLQSDANGVAAWASPSGDTNAIWGATTNLVNSATAGFGPYNGAYTTLQWPVITGDTYIANAGGTNIISILTRTTPSGPPGIYGPVYSSTGSMTNVQQFVTTNANEGDLQVVSGGKIIAQSKVTALANYAQQSDLAASAASMLRSVSNRTTVSVKDFGALGDGTTDDTAAFLAAMAYINTNTNSATLFVPAGKYPINSTLYLTNAGSGIIGETASQNMVYGAGTTIYFTSNNTPIIVVTTGQNRIENLKLMYSTAQGVGNSGSTALQLMSSGIKVHNLVFRNVYGAVYQYGAQNVVANNYLTKLLILSASGYYVKLYGQTTTTLQDSYFVNAIDHQTTSTANITNVTLTSGTNLTFYLDSVPATLQVNWEFVVSGLDSGYNTTYFAQSIAGNVVTAIAATTLSAPVSTVGKITTTRQPMLETPVQLGTGDYSLINLDVEGAIVTAGAPNVWGAQTNKSLISSWASFVNMTDCHLENNQADTGPLDYIDNRGKSLNVGIVEIINSGVNPGFSNFVFFANGTPGNVTYQHLTARDIGTNGAFLCVARRSNTRAIVRGGINDSEGTYRVGGSGLVATNGADTLFLSNTFVLNIPIQAPNLNTNLIQLLTNDFVPFNGASAIAASGTSGFVYLPTINAYTATGTPDTYASQVPIAVSTNSAFLYSYFNSKWNYLPWFPMSQAAWVVDGYGSLSVKGVSGQTPLIINASNTTYALTLQASSASGYQGVGQRFKRFYGTPASYSGMPSAGRMMDFVSAGTASTTNSYDVAELWTEATEAWTATNAGTRFVMSATPKGQTTESQILSMAPEGITAGSTITATNGLASLRTNTWATSDFASGGSGIWNSNATGPVYISANVGGVITNLPILDGITTSNGIMAQVNVKAATNIYVAQLTRFLTNSTTPCAASTDITNWNASLTQGGYVANSTLGILTNSVAGLHRISWYVSLNLTGTGRVNVYTNGVLAGIGSGGYFATDTSAGADRGAGGFVYANLSISNAITLRPTSGTAWESGQFSVELVK